MTHLEVEIIRRKVIVDVAAYLKVAPDPQLLYVIDRLIQQHRDEMEMEQRRKHLEVLMAVQEPWIRAGSSFNWLTGEPLRDSQPEDDAILKLEANKKELQAKLQEMKKR